MTYKPRVVLDELGARDFKPSGLSGSSAASRYVGATATGAPSSGTYATGDFVIAQNGSVWICTVAGSPGTWTQITGGGGGTGNVTWRGTWSNSTTYSTNDVILYSSRLWVATATNTNNAPTAASSSTNMWATNTPTTLSNNGSTRFEVGERFTVAADGNVISARFYKESGDPYSTRTLRLWDTTTSSLIGSVTTTSETTGAWNTVTFASPIAVISTKTYLISMDASYWGYNTSMPAETGQVTHSGTQGYLNSTPGSYPSSPWAFPGNNAVAVDVNFTPNATWTEIASLSLDGDTDVAISSPLSGQVLGYSGALSKWVNQNVAGVSATTSTAQLGANVSMPSANTWYDGPSLSLPPGMWFLTGNLVFSPQSASGLYTVQIWDGTTTAASSSATDVTGSYLAVSVAALVTVTTTTTYKISAAGDHTSGLMLAAAPANAVGNNASYLRAIQLSGNPVGQQAPAVRCYNSANISIPTGFGSATALTFDSNRYDQGTSVSQHSTSSNTSRVTCQQSGIYEIFATLEFADNQTGRRIVLLRLNGSTEIARQEHGVTVSTSDAGQKFAISTQYYLSVGDYVEVCIYQTSGGSLNVLHTGNYSPEFGMARIDSGPGAVQPNTKVQLDYAATTDIASGTSLTLNTWTNIGSSQTFIVDDSNSLVEVIVNGGGLIGTVQGQVSTRIVIDGSTTKRLGMGVVPSGGYTNPLSSTSPIELTGLSVGSHTIQVQVLVDQSSQLFYMRPSSFSNTESFSVRVLERKQSTSPPSSTPAPAVRCYNNANISVANATIQALTFNTNRFDQGTSTPQHSTSSNTSRLTCQQAGVYQITGLVRFDGSGTGANRIAILRLNGVTEIARQNIIIAGATQMQGCVTANYQLAIGDYLELCVYQDSGGSLNIEVQANYSPEFMMVRVDSGGQGFVPIPMVKTANYTILNTDAMVVAGASSLTFTLPLASTRAPGMPLLIKNDNFTGTSIVCSGSDTIDGATSFSLSGAYSAIQLVGDGISVWRVF